MTTAKGCALMVLYYIKNKRLLFLPICTQITLSVMISCSAIPKRHIHVTTKKQYDTGLFCNNCLKTDNLGKCELGFTQI